MVNGKGLAEGTGHIADNCFQKMKGCFSKGGVLELGNALNFENSKAYVATGTCAGVKEPQPNGTCDSPDPNSLLSQSTTGARQTLTLLVSGAKVVF